MRRWHHQLAHLNIHKDWSRSVFGKNMKFQNVIKVPYFLSDFHHFWPLERTKACFHDTGQGGKLFNFSSYPIYRYTEDLTPGNIYVGTHKTGNNALVLVDTWRWGQLNSAQISRFVQTEICIVYMHPMHQKQILNKIIDTIPHAYLAL